MTQMENAREGIITLEIRLVAQSEHLPLQTVMQGVAEGKIVIPANINHKNLIPCGIGRMLRTKINATAMLQTNVNLTVRRRLAGSLAPMNLPVSASPA